MLTGVDYSKCFLMFERCPGGYQPHIFNNSKDFKTWMGTHDHGFMVPRSAVNGYMFSAIDHRYDDLFDSDDFIDDYICLFCGSQESIEIDRRDTNWLTIIHRRCIDCGHVSDQTIFK